MCNLNFDQLKHLNHYSYHFNYYFIDLQYIQQNIILQPNKSRCINQWVMYI